VHNVRASVIQCDEIWSFTYAKQKNVAGAKAAPEGAGDTWTWTALDSTSKLIVSYMVGRARRNHGRLANMSRMDTLPLFKRCWPSYVSLRRSSRHAF
jgi:IS1 family transposase